MKLNILSSTGTIFMIFIFMSTFLQDKYKDEENLIKPEKAIMEQEYSNVEMEKLSTDFNAIKKVKKDGYNYRTYYTSFEEDNLFDKRFTQ